MRHLHAPGAADSRVGDVAVAGDLVGRVDDDHPLAQVVGENPRHLAQLGGFSDPRPPQDQQALAGFDQIAQQFDPAEHRPSHAQGQADDVTLAVAYSRNAVQGPLDAGAVVPAEFTDQRRDVGEILLADRRSGELDNCVRKARLGKPPQVHHHFEKPVQLDLEERALQLGRQGGDQEENVLPGGFFPAVLHASSSCGCDGTGGALLRPVQSHYTVSRQSNG